MIDTYPQLKAHVFVSVGVCILVYTCKNAFVFSNTNGGICFNSYSRVVVVVGCTGGVFGGGGGWVMKVGWLGGRE